MTLLDVMLKRRSIRKYTDDKISDEDLNKILTAGLLAPTSRNRKPCEFIVVKDKDTLKKLSKASHSCFCRYKKGWYMDWRFIYCINIYGPYGC